MLLRKSASVLLLLVLVFNMIGYRAWFYFAEQQSDAVLESRLDQNKYSENELISLSIPLYNPYQLEQKSFERVNGEISYQGTTFKFVKRKISQGNLILLCIPNTGKMLLKKAKSDFANEANNIANTGKGNSGTGTQKMYNGSDFTIHSYHFSIGQPEQTNNMSGTDRFLSNLSDAHVAFPGKPPRFIA